MWLKMKLTYKSQKILISLGYGLLMALYGYQRKIALNVGIRVLSAFIIGTLFMWVILYAREKYYWYKIKKST